MANFMLWNTSAGGQIRPRPAGATLKPWHPNQEIIRKNHGRVEFLTHKGYIYNIQERLRRLSPACKIIVNLYCECVRMSFMDWLNGLLGGALKKPAAGGQTGGQTQTRVKNRQVYEGRAGTVPEWAAGLNVSDLLDALRTHSKCRYAPNFGQKKIMSTSIGADGNLIPEYNGIAGDCGAIKNFGMKVATKRGMSMPFRYFDLKTAYEACCGIPAKCPFFMYAENEAASVNSKMKR